MIDTLADPHGPAGGGDPAGDGREILATAVDLDFVPRPLDTVATRSVGGESVLLDQASGTVYRLDAVGSVVWSTFDGSADLGQLADELADAFHTDVGVVGRDVVDLTRTLAQIGLLDGIAAPAAHSHHDAGPVGTQVGDELPRFRLPGLDGVVVDLAERRGSRVLLVNWSPGCGYCVMIAPELDALRPALAEQGVEVILLAAGDAASNRALLDDLDVDLPVLLRSGAGPDFVDPFPGMGTPAAYLVDADGRVAAPLVSGAYQVPALARTAAGRVATPSGDLPAVRYVPGAADGMCGAGGSGVGGGGRVAQPRTWTPTVAYRIGDHHLGVRADTAETADLVRRLLAGLYAGDDPNVPANFSVVLGAPAPAPGPVPGTRRAPRDLKILLQGSTSVVRSRSSRRVLLGLASFLDSYRPLSPSAPDAGLLRTGNLAVVVGGEAILLPPAVRGAVEQLQSRLVRFGAQLVDEPYASVDPVRRELVVAPPAAGVDLSVLDQLDEPPAGAAEPPRIEAGRYPLRAWAMWDSGDSSSPQLTPAEALAQALTTLAVPPGSLVVAADLLAELLATAPPALLSTGGGELTDQLRPFLDR